MNWRVEFTGNAAKQLTKIPKKQRLMVTAWIAEHLDGCENPRAIPGSKQLQGTESGWRWRVGSYRVLGRLDDGVLTIEVVRVGHRQGVYKNLPRM